MKESKKPLLQAGEVVSWELQMLHLLTFLFVMMIAVDLASAESRQPIKAIDLAGIRDIGGHNSGAMSVSPNGDYVAFQLQTPIIEERNYKLTWYVAETKPGGDIWPVGDGGDLILNPEMGWATTGNRPPVAPLWSPDGKWIIYLKRSQGNTQIWRSRRDGRVQEQLTYRKGDVLSATFDSEAPPSFKFITDNVLLFAVAEDPETVIQQLRDEGDRGYLYNKRFFPGLKVSPFIRSCGFWQHDRRVQVSLFRSCEPQLWVYDFDKKKETRATQDEVAAYHASTDIHQETLADRDIRLIRRAPDGNSQLWFENEDPKRYPGSAAPVRLFASVDGKEFRCAAPQCEAYGGVIEGIWWRPGASEIIFQKADGSNKSMTGIYAWTPGSTDVRTILQTEDHLEDCQIFETRAICLREQWTHPRTVLSLDLNNGGIQTIYDPNPEFDNLRFSRIEKIEWEDEFGAAAHGHLVYPINYRKGHRYPVVITTYRSRGFLRGATGDEYPIHLLAANGFMVLSYDKQRNFERFATIVDRRQAEWEDLHERRSSLSAQERALEILDERGLIDLKRTAITGLSDGADQVRFALIHTDSFTTGITSGAADYHSLYYLSNEHWRSFWEQRLGGAPDEDKEGHWRTLSFWRNVDQVDAPYLANVSSSELLFSVENLSRFEEAGRAAEMYIFPGEYHMKWQPQHRLAIYRRNVQWLKFWLQGEEVRDPVDSEQYARWRVMRNEQCARLEGKDAPWYCRQ